MKNEELCIVDSHDNETGSIQKSELRNNPQLIYRGVRLILLNINREILLSQRSLTKSIAPGVWDSAAAGHVRYKETPIEAMIRETKEELGITISPVFYNKYFHSSYHPHFVYYYYALSNEKDFRVDAQEVERYEWVPIAMLDNFAKTHELDLNRNSFKIILTLIAQLEKDRVI